MSSFDFFKEIYCINLDHRLDRWEHAKKEFSSLGILDRVRRFSAIKESDGRLGVIKSNLSLIRYARERDLDNILVFEDDIKFLSKDVGGHLQVAIEQLANIDWTLFYLGANLHTPLERISENLLIAKKAYGVHALCYSKKSYDKLINYYSEIFDIKWENILDVYFVREFQENSLCVLIYPIIATQMNSYSDIEKRDVNQEYIEQRYWEYTQ